MTSLLEHTVAQPTKHSFFAKKIDATKHFLDISCSDFSKLSQKFPKFDFSKISLAILIFLAKNFKLGE